MSSSETSTPATIAEDQVTISVDRAIGHYLGSIEVNPVAVAAYYDTLPFDSKPPLEDCHIHFSALAPRSGGSIGRGIYYPDPADSKRGDPQAPAANIVIFIGSMLATGSLDELDKTLAHELTHYADPASPTRTLTDKERVLIVQKMLLKGRLAQAIFVGKAALFGGALELTESIFDKSLSFEQVGLIGLGMAGLHSLLKRRSKRERLKKVNWELHDLYLAREEEQEARELAATAAGHSLINTRARDINMPILARQRGKRNRIGDYNHKQLSRLAPQEK